MATNKTKVIELIFNDPLRWNGDELVNPLVTLVDVSSAIEAYNRGLPPLSPKSARLSSNNPANFFKDFTRKFSAADKNWPASVLARGYTAIQRTGEGICFEFVPLGPGQTSAFPAAAVKYPKSPATTKLHIIQTLSVERLTKSLARRDENWLQSVAVTIHIPHTHLALHPHANLPLVHVGHMQSNMKLRKAEIDGLYLGTLSDGKIVLITMEAKGINDDILESQIIEQIEAIRSAAGVREFLRSSGIDENDTLVMPMAMKLVDLSCARDVPTVDMTETIGTKLLYMVDYGLKPYNAVSTSTLVPRAETLFDLRPPVKGVNG